MASAWIVKATTPRGERRYRVQYRVGGRESRTQYAGSFGTMREAEERPGLGPDRAGRPQGA